MSLISGKHNSSTPQDVQLQDHRRARNDADEDGPKVRLLHRGDFKTTLTGTTKSFGPTKLISNSFHLIIGKTTAVIPLNSPT